MIGALLATVVPPAVVVVHAGAKASRVSAVTAAILVAMVAIISRPLVSAWGVAAPVGVNVIG